MLGLVGKKKKSEELFKSAPDEQTFPIISANIYSEY